MRETLYEVVGGYLEEFETLRKITAGQLSELGYHRSGTLLQVETYPEGRDKPMVKMGFYKMEREITEKPAKFCFLAPSKKTDETQEGVIIDKPFSYFEKLT